MLRLILMIRNHRFDGSPNLSYKP